MFKQSPRFIASRSTHVGIASTALLMAAILATQTTAAEAANSPVCAPRAELLKQLSSKYKEVPVAVGLSSSGSLVEVLTNDSGSTWTIMVSQPNGASCLVAAGEGWEELKRVASSDRGA
jgi:hypothetical protein